MISKHKNKSNIVHPAQIYQDGNVYDIRFEGYEDKNEFNDSNPRKIGRKLDLYLDGDELINYKGITDACEKTGIAASTLMYNYYKYHLAVMKLKLLLRMEKFITLSHRFSLFHAEIN